MPAFSEMAVVQTFFTPPTDLTFSIGSTDGDVMLDELLHLYKGPKRLPNKSRTRGLSKHAARSALQKSVTSRSSALRQGKFAEVRSHDGAEPFPAAKAAGVKALTVPIVARDNKLKKNSERKGKLAKALKVVHRKFPTDDAAITKK